MRDPIVPTVVLLAALALAGCMGPSGEIPDHFVGEGSNAFHIPADWAYAGNGVRAVDGSIRIDIVDSSNTGTVTASITDGNTTHEFRFENFSASAGFQDGGIVHGIYEHGDSGHGHKKIPRSYALSAGWGSGTIETDGEPHVDPVTGTTRFALHYMVFQGGIRDDETHAIHDSSGEGTYSPADPGDASVDPSDREIHFVAKSPVPSRHAFTNTSQGTVTDADYQQGHPIPVASTRSTISIQLRLEPPDDNVAPAELNFTLLTPSDTTAAQTTLGGASQEQSGRLQVDGPPEAGTYVLRVTGSGAQTRYTADTLVSYPDRAFFHYVFEDVSLDQEIDVDVDV